MKKLVYESTADERLGGFSAAIEDNNASLEARASIYYDKNLTQNNVDSVSIANANVSRLYEEHGISVPESYPPVYYFTPDNYRKFAATTFAGGAEVVGIFLENNITCIVNHEGFTQLELASVLAHEQLHSTGRRTFQVDYGNAGNIQTHALRRMGFTVVDKKAEGNIFVSKALVEEMCMSYFQGKIKERLLEDPKYASDAVRFYEYKDAMQNLDVINGDMYGIGIWGESGSDFEDPDHVKVDINLRYMPFMNGRKGEFYIQDDPDKLRNAMHGQLLDNIISHFPESQRAGIERLLLIARKDTSRILELQSLFDGKFGKGTFGRLKSFNLEAISLKDLGRLVNEFEPKDE